VTTLNKAGVRADLLDLAKLPYVKGHTARVFWEGGLQSIGAVAESDVEDIIPLLVKVTEQLAYAETGAIIVKKEGNG